MARVLIAACLVACVTYVHTWGIVGHVVTGQIAQSQLSNAGKAMVMDVLSNYVGPNGEKFKDLGTLAPYADVLRPYYPWAAGYHFINIPVRCTTRFTHIHRTVILVLFHRVTVPTQIAFMEPF
jgi:hypothetical protein